MMWSFIVCFVKKKKIWLNQAITAPMGAQGFRSNLIFMNYVSTFLDKSKALICCPMLNVPLLPFHSRF